MSHANDEALLQAVLDAWDRNNSILVNLLGSIGQAGRNARATASSPSVSEMFAHIIYVRLIFVKEDAPECAVPDDLRSWLGEREPARLEEGLRLSARAVADAFVSRLRSGHPMLLHYDHPLLFLQHMIWHEGYHHGQIKLALKLAGHPLDDQLASPLTWGVWMNKTNRA